MEKYSIVRPDGTALATFVSLPEGKSRGWVHVVHGMAEHAQRYGRLAKELNTAGWAFVSQDIRGQGQTWNASEPYGLLADQDGWNKAIADLTAVKSEYVPKGASYFVLGHSAGALMSLSYAQQYPISMKGLILSALAPDQGVLRAAGQAIAGLQCNLGRSRRPSKLMSALTFGAFNSQFKPNRTDFDWLSRDPVEVDKYISDPLCGGVCTAAFFKDLLGGVKANWQEENLSKLRKDLSIYLLSGSSDPVVLERKGAEKTFEILKRYVSDIDQKIYPEARHEILNETNRHEVMADIVTWLGQRQP